MSSSIDWKSQWPTCALPIDEHLGEILSAVERHQVVICAAETGSGKSTRIPQALYWSMPNRMITVTQPRRFACREVARRIAYEMNCELGDIVGYHIRLDSRRSANTKVLLEVEQSLINSVRKARKLPEGVIMIDEVHGRSVECDLLLAILRSKLSESPKTKVVLTSATLDSRKLVDYFSPMGSVALIELKVDTNYPVKEVRYNSAYKEHHVNTAISMAILCVQKFFANELRESYDEGTNLTKGAILVLLPGRIDLDNAKEQLESEASRGGSSAKTRLEVITCSGETKRDVMDQIMSPVSPNRLRIVCGTEIFRVSLTVPDLVGVIDAMKVKRITTNESGNGKLRTILISEAESRQAKGRVGRISPGFYVRSSEILEPSPQPQILLQPLTRAALEIASHGFCIRDCNLLDKPERGAIDVALKKLEHLQALDTSGVITDLGESLIKLPLDPERAMVLLTAAELDVLQEAILIVAFMELGEQSFSRKDTALRNEYKRDGDFACIVDTLRLLHAGKKSDDFKLCGAQRREFDLIKERVRELMLEVYGDRKRKRLTEQTVWTAREYAEVALTQSLVSGMLDNIAVASSMTLRRESVCSRSDFAVLWHQSFSTRLGTVAVFGVPVSQQLCIDYWRKVIVWEPGGHLQYNLKDDTVTRKEFGYFKGGRVSRTVEVKSPTEASDVVTDFLVLSLRDPYSERLPWPAHIKPFLSHLFRTSENLRIRYKSHDVHEELGQLLRTRLQCLRNRVTCLREINNEMLGDIALTTLDVHLLDKQLQSKQRELEAERMRRDIEERRRAEEMEKERERRRREQSGCHVM